MKLYFYAFCILALLPLFGCGGSDSNYGYVSVEVSPTTATVATSSTTQLTAKVKNTKNTEVTWLVNGVTGGNTTYGTISATGLYTAPASVPSPAAVTVTVISKADTTRTAEATVTVAVPMSVSPSTTSVAVTSTQQFTASVTFSSNTAVTWQVNGVAGGNSTVGTIDSNGLYTAPSSVPSPNTVTVTATSKADTARSVSATVTVTPPTMTISPTDATISAGVTQAYTATAQSTTIHPAWKVTCASQVSGACGTITSDGTYTAPLAPPPNGKVEITASMPDGTATTASATATIQFGNASLSGTYIFAIADNIGNKAPSQTGALVFDGAGKITGGILDSTDKPGTPLSVTGGSYTAGTDGRGTATVQMGSASLALQFVLSNHVHGALVRTDSGANQAAGTIELQQTSTASALNGSYALSASGPVAGGSSAMLAEAGSLTVSSTGTISGGVIDTNKDLALQTTNVTGGSVAQSTNGYRGTLTFTTSAGTQVFAWYPVDSKHARLVGIDGAFAGTGDLFLQPQGPLSDSTLKRRYVFSVSGTKAGNPFGVAGVMSMDGAGTVSDLQFDGIAQTVFDSKQGAYTVTDPQTGRTTATWTANGGSKLQYVLYPRSDGGYVMLASDGVYMGTGEALPQASLWVYNTPQYAFALRLGGGEVSTASTAERITARLVASSTTTLVGTADGTTVGQATDLTLNLLTQDAATHRYTYGISCTKLAGGPFVVYRIDDDRAFVIEQDETRLLMGVLQRQY